jgi:hypothetical protein
MILCVHLTGLNSILTRRQVEMIRAQAGALKGAPVDQIVRVSHDPAMMFPKADILGRGEEEEGRGGNCLDIHQNQCMQHSQSTYSPCR